MMNISETILKRKSIRSYMDKPVPADDLEKIIEAGRWAPNAGPYQITVVRNSKLRIRINDRTHEAMIHSGIDFLQQRASLPGYQPLYGAPVLILLSAPDESPYGSVNAALAAQNMLLEATARGLGTCYLVSPSLALNGEKNASLSAEAGIPEGYGFKCAVIIGYAAVENKFTAVVRSIKGNVNYID
jgi:FMN reductase [NAD(P)H]